MRVLELRRRAVGSFSRALVLVIVLGAHIESGLAQVVGLALSSGIVNSGSTVSLSLNLTGGSPAGIQFTASFSPTDFNSVSMTPGPAATSAGKAAQCNGGPGWITCILSGINTNTMPTGVVGNLNLTAAPQTLSTSKSAPIQLAGVIAASLAGDGILTSATGSTVTIQPAIQPPSPPSQPVLSQLTCSPTAMPGSSNASCTATLSAPAPAGGSTLTLTSISPLQVPPSVGVVAGASAATFTAYAPPLLLDQQSQVSAAVGGGSKSVAFTLVGIKPTSISCDATTLKPGGKTTCRVALNTLNIPVSFRIALMSNSVAIRVPSSILVNSKPDSLTFVVTAAQSKINVTQTAIVSAVFNSAMATTTLTLTP